MKRAALFALAMMMPMPAYAQLHGIDIRPFASAADQRFAASTTFNAVLGSSAESVWGGGVDVVIHKDYFVDLAISRMSKTGQQVFINNGEVFGLTIPVHVTMTPIEVAGGYRFRFRGSRIIPYAGAGFGSYSYREAADFAQPGDDVDLSHLGFLMMGGAEFRLSRWVAVTGDAQYTHVPGIIGQGGNSQGANEHDLGGIAVRVRVIVGR